ncbi:MAG: preprotein translocase subunit YajC [Actinomycetia bacterium]|nr:preprotein translocase subunit YajC [Actinomycetes bacterium]
MRDLIVVAVLALPLIGVWLLIRGQQRRAQQAARLASGLRVGQDVVTTSGLYGTIAALDETEATLRVAPGVELRYDRRAIGQVVGEDGDTPGLG